MYNILSNSSERVARGDQTVRLLRLKWFLLPLVLLGHGFCAQAAELNSYNASVALNNNTAANNPEILKQGLLQVLIQVSGNPELEKTPLVQQALKNPESYLLKYTVQVVEPNQKFSLQTYAPNRVDALLKSVGVNTAQTEATSETVNITVRGINTLDEYAAVQKYLENLTIVRNVKLTKLKGDSLLLAINSKSGRANLLNTLSQDNKLKLENTNLSNLGQPETEPLQFRWTREL